MHPCLLLASARPQLMATSLFEGYLTGIFRFPFTRTRLLHRTVSRSEGVPVETPEYSIITNNSVHVFAYIPFSFDIRLVAYARVAVNSLGGV